jgi:uncharacterized protein (TIGR02145 family)
MKTGTVTDLDGNVCPTGWHVPADEEWSELKDFPGGEHAAKVADAVLLEGAYPASGHFRPECPRIPDDGPVEPRR